jgi:hypothetical protein
MTNNEERANNLAIKDLANSLYKDDECRVDTGLISLENESTFGLVNTGRKTSKLF